MSGEEVVGGNIDDFDEQKFVGGKKKNGHKMNCMCPICKNMAAKAKRRGYTDDELKKQEKKKGNKKANGHRLNCQCPICKNMAKHKKRGRDSDEVDEYNIMLAGKKMKKYKYSKKRKSRKSKKTKKSKKTRKTRK